MGRAVLGRKDRKSRRGVSEGWCSVETKFLPSTLPATDSPLSSVFESFAPFAAKTNRTSAASFRVFRGSMRRVIPCWTGLW